MASVVIPLEERFGGPGRRVGSCLPRKVTGWRSPGTQQFDRQPVVAPRRRGRAVVAEGTKPVHATVAVYRRRRLVAAALAVSVCTALVVAVIVVAGSLGGRPLPAPEAPSVPAAAAIAATRVVVQPGDTLWSIARRLQPTGDVRGLVDRLAAANGGAALRPGQALVVDCCGG